MFPVRVTRVSWNLSLQSLGKAVNIITGPHRNNQSIWNNNLVQQHDLDGILSYRPHRVTTTAFSRPTLDVVCYSSPLGGAQPRHGCPLSTWVMTSSLSAACSDTSRGLGLVLPLPRPTRFLLTIPSWSTLQELLMKHCLFPLPAVCTWVWAAFKTGTSRHACS